MQIDLKASASCFGYHYSEEKSIFFSLRCYLCLIVIETFIQIPKQEYLCLDKWYYNDKPTDGFQQKHGSKPKTLSWDFYRKLY